MIVDNEPYLIEYNVRMGDPECQTILPTLETDLIEILLACCEEKLSKIKIKWAKNKSLCIVMCSKGYPESFKKDVEIKNLNKINLNKNEYLFHAGTKKKNNKTYANGGRVLNFVSVGNNFSKAKKSVLKNIKYLKWSGGFYRKDIGYKVIND